MLKVALAAFLLASPACAAEVSVACHVSDEQRFITDAHGHISLSKLSPQTTETFTIMDTGLKGFPEGETTPDHANGISEKDGTKRSVFIDRKTGSLMEVWEFASTPQGLSARWVQNGLCQKSEGF